MLRGCGISWVSLFIFSQGKLHEKKMSMKYSRSEAHTEEDMKNIKISQHSGVMAITSIQRQT